MQSKEPQSHVHYHVTVDWQRHEIAVEMRLTGPIASGEMRLEIPTWVPGDYSFAPLARDLFLIEARSTPKGEPLEVTRDGWQAFRVRGGQGDVTVEYRASASATELGESSGIVDGEYAILLGTRYLHCPAHLGACTVAYEVPRAWKDTIHHPSGAKKLSPEPGQPDTVERWSYPSYEVLLDTPVVMGKTDCIERRVMDVPFYFVFVDRGIGYEEGASAFVDKVVKAAEDMHEVFGKFPFPDYTFVLSLSADWGLEHLTSSMCGLGQDVFTDPDENAKGVRVCAHELFHAWNVRRLRPAPLGHLSTHLTSGCFTEGLWLAEGFTRYYEFLSCTRAKVYTPDQFLSSVVGYYEHLCAAPAYRRVSGADSSLTAYLNHYPKYAGRTSNAIDYYDHGMLVAFEVDAALRFDKDRPSSLDAGMREFYAKYAGYGRETAGYTTKDAIQFFSERSPHAGRMMAAAVEKPGALEVEEMLAEMGFEVITGQPLQLGLVFLNDGAPTIDDVLDDSPAGRSGIAPGDVIKGVNGFAYTSSGLKWAAGQRGEVTLEVARGHRRLSFEMKPEPREKITGLVWRGKERQAQLMRAWLGPGFDATRERSIDLGFYENFHGIETVL
jgi:predicted metalloprotease with PDZ domain